MRTSSVSALCHYGIATTPGAVVWCRGAAIPLIALLPGFKNNGTDKMDEVDKMDELDSHLYLLQTLGRPGLASPFSPLCPLSPLLRQRLQVFLSLPRTRLLFSLRLPAVCLIDS